MSPWRSANELRPRVSKDVKVGDFDIDVTSVRIGGGWQAEAIMPDGKKVTSAPQSSREDAEHDVKQQAEARLYPQRRYDVNRPFESMSEGGQEDWYWRQHGFLIKLEAGTYVPKSGLQPVESAENAYIFQSQMDANHYGRNAITGIAWDVVPAASALMPHQHRFESMSNFNENKWLKGAVNPKHKGYCTPMTKKTCTPARKALARRFKSGDLEHESIQAEADRLLEPLDERKLSTQARKNLPQGDFVFPKGRRYPIEDKSHARNALARVSQHGSSAEKAKVRSAVHRKYPEIGEADEAIVRHQADRLLEIASVDSMPPYQNFNDNDEEVNAASRSGFTAWELAQRRNRHHPKLERAITGTPYEPMYRKKFMPKPKASFYPSDGGSAGGGGGITST